AGSPASRIAIVQANLDLGSQWRQEFYGRNLEQYMRLTLQELRTSQPQLVFWPESAMTFFLGDQPLYQAAIGHVLDAFGAELVAGGPYTASRDADAPIFHNAAFSLAPSGRITARYDKEHLLPFAEYFPLRLDLLRRTFGRVREFTPGTTTSLLPTVAGLAGVLICNEAMFPDVARDRVRAGAELLVNLTNDTWVGDRTFSSIAFDMAVLRAIEQRRYLVRASTAGPSAIVDPWGRIVTETPLFTQTTTTGSVAPAHGLTAYARLGDAFAIACGLVAAAALLRRARLA
ncbi:MAG: apolipoprotein N-acyltransferase, partial [Candidatus Binatia bacterium]